MQHLNGIYWLLANVPAWATTLVLSTGTLTALFVGRHRLERMPYQVSYSAQIGEGVFFVVIVLIAEGILARGGTVPDWLYDLDGDAHIALMVVCMCLGLLVFAATLKSRSGQAMDIYHDVVIGPAIAYCAFTLLPLISTSGTDLEWGVTVALTSLWVGLVFYDIWAKLLNQRAWLIEHGRHVLSDWRNEAKR